MELNAISKEEMKEIIGGKKMISCTLAKDSLGSYYVIRYDDGSVEYVAVDWYA